MHDISRCDANALEGVGNLLAGCCRTDQRWERRHDAQGAWSHCGCAIQMLLARRRHGSGGVLVSARRVRVCPPPFHSLSPILQAQLSSAQLPPSHRRRPHLEAPAYPHPISHFPRLSRLSSLPSADRLEPFETARGGERYPGWWFGGDRATRGREGLERKGGRSRPGVS